MDNVTFTPTTNSGPNGTFNTDISVSVNDQSGAGEQTVLAPTTLTITRTNDAPTATAGGLLTWSEGDGATAIDTGVNLADPDDLSMEGAVIQITNNLDAGNDILAFTPSAAISVASWAPTSGTLTLTGTATVAEYQSALRQVTFENTSVTPGTLNRTIRWTVSDGDLNSAAVTSTVQVNSVDSTPILQNNSLSLLEGESVTVTSSDISATDADSPAATLVFHVIGVTAGQFEFVSAPGTAVLSFSQSQISAGEVRFVHNGSEAAPTYSLSVSDGNSTSGPVAANISFTNINDDPFNSGSLPASIEVTEDTSSNADLSSINLQDPDSLSGNLSLTLSTTAGGTLNSAAAGGVNVSGSGTTSLTLTGTQAALNTFLNNSSSILYTGTTNTYGNAADSIQLSLTDNGNTGLGGGGNIALGNVSVNIAPDNDSPINSVPATISAGEESTTNVSGISISDVDAGSGIFTTQLQVTNGTLNVTLVGGTSISAGSNGTSVLTVSGNTADINATLATLTYRGNLNVTGPAADSLTVTTDDGGNFGGAARQDVDSITINISNVNDEQTVSTNNTLSINEGHTGVVISRSLLETTDVDNSPAELIYTVNTTPSAGTLRLGGAHLSVGGTFTQQDINNGLLTWDHDDSEVFTDGFDFTVDDSVGTTSTSTFVVNIIPVNDNTPVITSNGGLAAVGVTITENTTVVTTVTATDADLPAQTMTYTIAGGTDQSWFTMTAGSGVLTFTAGPDFESPTDAGSDNVYEVIVRASDGQGLTTQQTINVTVTDVDEFDVSGIVDANGSADQVPENSVIGTATGITAFSEDLDGTSNSITYSLDNDAAGLFTIDSFTGVITTAAVIDFETTGSTLNIVARATGADTSTTTRNFTITVIDTNDTGGAFAKHAEKVDRMLLKVTRAMHEDEEHADALVVRDQRHRGPCIETLLGVIVRLNQERIEFRIGDREWFTAPNDPVGGAGIENRGRRPVLRWLIAAGPGVVVVFAHAGGRNDRAARANDGRGIGRKFNQASVKHRPQRRRKLIRRCRRHSE